MPLQFATLASGSRGNCAWLRAGVGGLLIDVGIGPRTIARRLASVGTWWEQISAVLLTHTHTDHVREESLVGLAKRKIPFFCHEGHELPRAGTAALEEAGLIKRYDERPFLTPSGMRVEPIALRHDAGPTYGFRIEGRSERRGRLVSLGYLADTGCWNESMADALTDIDLLAVEFNHDVRMQLNSNRPRALIERVLGDRGHLSNEQGAGLVSAVMARSASGAVRNLVLLHLSQECNRPELAIAAAQKATRESGRRASIHAAEQHVVSPTIAVRPARRRRRPIAMSSFAPPPPQPSRAVG